MAINYKPGQILYIRSSMGPWYYISFLHFAKPINDDKTYELHTCCDLCIEEDGSECLTFVRGNSSLLDFNTSFEEVREATRDEIEYLHKALVKAFKDYDLGWDKHFTDSTYSDIQDWLYWAFDVDINLLPNDSTLHETIYEITNYIWDVLCKETGNYQEKTTEHEMVNKQEFIEKVIKWVKNGDNVEKYLHVRTSLTDNFADALRKYLEE